MPTKQPLRVEIRKSRSKKNPFKVAVIAGNGEILMTSELLSTRKNCIKNLLSVMRVFQSVEVVVVDHTAKSNQHFILDFIGVKNFNYDKYLSQTKTF